jgi:hypothetical protein
MRSSAAVNGTGVQRSTRDEKGFIFFGFVVLMMEAHSAFAATQTCAIINGGTAGPGMGVSPIYVANQDGRANEGCNVLITFNADGSITITNPNPSPSYDNGRDDNMIGVINNSGKVITSLQFSNATTDIFGFDGDGVCNSPPGWTFSSLGPNPNCAIATDPTHYGPAGITFSVTNPYGSFFSATVELHQIAARFSALRVRSLRTFK